MPLDRNLNQAARGGLERLKTGSVPQCDCCARYHMILGRQEYDTHFSENADPPDKTHRTGVLGQDGSVVFIDGALWDGRGSCKK